MNGVDYTKKLDQARRDYHRDAADNNRNHAIELKGQKSAADYRLNKQAETHKAKIEAIEDKYTVRMDEMSDAQRKNLKRKNESFQAKLKENVDSANSEKSKNVSEWNKKYKDLKESFTKSRETQEKGFNKLTGDQAEKYKERLANLEADKEIKLKTNREQTQEVLAKSSEKAKQDYKSLEAEKQKQIADLKYPEKLDKMRSDFQSKMQSQKNSHKENLESVSQAAEYRSNKQSKTYQNSIKNIEDTYDQRSKELSTEQKRAIASNDKTLVDKLAESRVRTIGERRDTIAKSQGKITEMRDDFNSNLSERQKTFDSIQSDREKSYKDNLATMQKNVTDKQEALTNDRNDKVDNLNVSWEDRYNDLKREHKSRSTSQQEAHDYKSDKQQTAYKESVRNIEDNFQKRATEINHNQKENINKQTLLFNDKIDQTRGDAHDNLIASNKNWGRKLDDAEYFFKKTGNEKDYNHNKVQNELKDNYNQNVRSAQKKFTNDLREYEKNSIGGREELIDKTNEEKRQLQRSHDEKMNSLVKSEIEKRNFIKNKVVRDVANLKEAQDNERVQSRERQAVNFKRITSEADDRIKATKDISNAEVKRVQEQQKDEIKKQNFVFTERYADQEKRNQKNIRDMEYMAKHSGIGDDDIGKSIQARRDAEIIDQRNERKQKYLDERDSMVKFFDKKLEENSVKYQDTYKQIREKNQDKLSSIQRMSAKDNELSRYNEKVKREDAAKNYEKSTRLVREGGESKLSNQMSNERLRTNSLKQAFHKTLTDAQTKAQEDLESARNEMVAEKKIIESRLNDQNAESTQILKKGYEKKITTITENYEKRIQKLTNEKKALVENSHEKLIAQKRSSDLALAKQAKQIRSRSNTEVENEKSRAEQKEAQLRGQINNNQSIADQKLQAQQLVNTKKINRIMHETEVKSQAEQTKYKDIIEQNERFFNREVERIQLANTNEKENLISKYENRIKKLNELYDSKAGEIEQFNKLSQS